MKRKTALWLILTALVVAISALLPEAALALQDARLESAVDTRRVETVDMSLLAELSIEDTLYMVQTYQSRVMLDTGRQLNEGQAGRIAIDTLVDVYDRIGYATGFYVTDAAPWLYVGPGGESVVLWEVTASGQEEMPLWAMLGDDTLRRVDALALVDERSGQVVSLHIRLADEDVGESTAPDGTALPDPVPTALPYGEVPEPEMWEITGAVGYTMMWMFADRLGLQGAPRDMVQDGEYGTYLDLTTDGGVPFTVTAFCDLNGLRFN